MGRIIVQEIRDNYPLYTELLKKRKSSLAQVIEISSVKPTNRHFLINDRVLLKHSTLSHEIFFISEVKARDYKYFLFKVLCNALCKIPFFRYDSDGATHRNYDERIPLSKKKVTTPHFHRFNSEGLSIAYKTKELLIEGSKKALEDIELCVAHFCHEGNIRSGEDSFPQIKILSKTLGFKMVDNDPNAGVNFL
jgi:hypothetical protein